MKPLLLAITAGLIATGPALAQGDAAAGEKTFKKCKSCHAIVSPEGEVIVKGGKVGPNLWGVVGRTAGTYEGFRYGASLVAAGEAGLVWTEETIAEYVADPKAYLAEFLGDSSVRSKMTFKLRKGGEDVAAYLASLTPAPQAQEEAEEEGSDG